MVSIVEGRMPQFDDSYDGRKLRTLVESLERRFLRINQALATKEFNFRARRPLAQTGIVTATPTIIGYSTEDWDVNGVYDTVTYRYFPTENGYYRVSAGAIIAALDTAKFVSLSIRKNGTNEYIGAKHYNNTGSAANTVALVTGDVSLDGDDYIDITIEHDHGSNLALAASTTQNFFSAYRIG